MSEAGASGWRRLAREPLLQFLLLGALFFAASTLLRARHDSPRLVVGAAEVAHQRELYRLQFGELPDDAQLEQLLQNHVREEALFREAVRLGLGEHDDIVRRRLVDKMAFLLRDSAAPPRPTAAELERWARAHGELATPGAQVSFRHLFFESRPGGPDARARAQAALDTLRRARGPAAAAALQADVFPPGDHFDAIDEAGARRLFGRSPLADALASAPVGTWAGPWESGFGWHLLLVEARAPAPEEPQDIERLRAAWERDWRERQLESAVERLVARYRVVRQPAEEAGGVAATQTAAAQ